LHNADREQLRANVSSAVAAELKRLMHEDPHDVMRGRIAMALVVYGDITEEVLNMLAEADKNPDLTRDVQEILARYRPRG